MPPPNAIGTHGNRRPGTASARTQSRNLPRIAGHASKPDGATPPARMASRGGQVAVRPRAGALFRSAIPVALAYAAVRRCYLRLRQAGWRNGCGIVGKSPASAASAPAARAGAVLAELIPFD